jgi:thymidylate kinase
MSKQIRGIILEGQSCSGKTSVINEIKHGHLEEDDAERNVIYLSEHYSQTLNWNNGELKNLSQEENLQVLSDRISLLEHLNSYANSMGEHSRRSRGLFFVYERFHMNYAYCYQDITSNEYIQLEHRLLNLNVQVVLLTISAAHVEQRLKHRATYTSETVNEESIIKYMENQQRFIDIAKKSILPTMILNTDNMDWEDYAKRILATL